VESTALVSVLASTAPLACDDAPEVPLFVDGVDDVNNFIARKIPTPMTMRATTTITIKRAVFLRGGVVSGDEDSSSEPDGGVGDKGSPIGACGVTGGGVACVEAGGVGSTGGCVSFFCGGSAVGGLFGVCVSGSIICSLEL
jgi:hypothetical protein